MSTQEKSLDKKRLLLEGDGEIAEKIRSIPRIAAGGMAEDPDRGILSLQGQSGVLAIPFRKSAFHISSHLLLAAGISRTHASYRLMNSSPRHPS